MTVAAPTSAEIPRLTEHLFRHEAGRLVSILTGIFGLDRLQMAEDVVQTALVRALQTWPYYGVPDNPPAWLLQTAKRLALDLIRREKSFREKEPGIIANIEQRLGDEESPHFDDEIGDQRLRLIFACCHPEVPLESQTALALKTLCGFSPSEITHSFLTTEAAIAKRLTRARQRIQEQGIPFEIPAGEELTPRLDGVLHTLYLLFNEGYKASSGEHLVREDLCHEAIRLTVALTEHPVTDAPRTQALLALMLLTAARLPARLDGEGNILRLQDQDRDTWDRGMINRGLVALGRAARGGELSEYHLQAGIAVCHAMALDYASTDWSRILLHYDRWMIINDSPVIALNRAVALSKVEGPRAGVSAVKAIQKNKQLGSYYLIYAVLGELESELGNFKAASAHFQKALQLSEVKSEQSFLTRRLEDSASKGKISEPLATEF